MSRSIAAGWHLLSSRTCRRSTWRRCFAICLDHSRCRGGPTCASKNDFGTYLPCRRGDNDSKSGSERPTSSFSVPGPEQHQIEVGKQPLHIVGFGGVGRFVAYNLASIHPPSSIHLTFATWGQLRGIRYEVNRSIVLKPHEDGNQAQKSGFSVELINPPETEDRKISELYSQIVEDKKHISMLVVCVKAYKAVTAINALRHRLTRQSTICFLQNGLGVVEAVNSAVFTDPQTRPTYLVGIVSHGVLAIKSGDFVHSGVGDITISRTPRTFGSSMTNTTPASFRDKYAPSESSKYLLKMMEDCTPLNVKLVSHDENLLLQLEKLAINCVINPLTAIYGLRNGDLLKYGHIQHVMRLLLSEVSQVLCSLPQVRALPSVTELFEATRLENAVRNIAGKTAKNDSSMRQDFMKGKGPGEIEFLNGWIVRQGEQLGIDCSANSTIVETIYELAKKSIKADSQKEK